MLLVVATGGCDSSSDSSSATQAAGAAGSGAGTTGSGASSGDAAGTDSGARGTGVFMICGVSSGQTCPAIDAYVACVQTACSSSLAKCFGPNNASGDFTGGVCAEYGQCALSATDPCHNNCSADAACQSCLGELVGCIQNSSCKVPACDGGTDGATAVDGGLTATCADLEACCASIADATGQTSCEQTLAAARARGGDSDCAVVYSTYVAAGICQ